MNYILLSLILLGADPAADTPRSFAHVQVIARATIISGETVNMSENGFLGAPAKNSDNVGYNLPLARSQAKQVRRGEPQLHIIEFY